MSSIGGSSINSGNPTITQHYIHIGEESVKQAITGLLQGNLLPESKKGKTDSQKITVLTDAERQISEIIS